MPERRSTQEQLDWTVELVGKRGWFAMIGGNTSFGSGGWDQTVWDGLIPVDMSGQGLQRSVEFWGGVAHRPSRAALHPIWKIVDDPRSQPRGAGHSADSTEPT